MATLTLTGELRLPGGDPIPGALLTARLSAAQKSGAYVVTGSASAVSDEDGHCELSVLIPDSGVVPVQVDVAGTVVAYGQVELEDPTQDVTLDLAEALATGIVQPVNSVPTRVVTVVTEEGDGGGETPDLSDYETTEAHAADISSLTSQVGGIGSAIASMQAPEFSMPIFVFQSGWVEVAPGATTTLTANPVFPYSTERWGGTVFALADRVQVRQYDGSEFASAEASSVVLDISPTQARISVTNHGEYNAQMRAVVLGTSYAFLFN